MTIFVGGDSLSPVTCIPAHKGVPWLFLSTFAEVPLAASPSCFLCPNRFSPHHAMPQELISLDLNGIVIFLSTKNVDLTQLCFKCKVHSTSYVLCCYHVCEALEPITNADVSVSLYDHNNRCDTDVSFSDKLCI